MTRVSRGRYNRVWAEIWDEPWSDDARTVAFYLLTCRHRTTEGLYRLPLAYATEDLGWPAERFREGLAELLREGFAKYDEGARVVLIVKALKRQPLENPNQVKSAVGQVAALPETPLLSELAALAERYCQRFAEGLRERFPEGFGEPLALALPPTPAPTPPPASAVADEEEAPEVSHLCTVLADLIETNGSKRPTITKAWRDAARLLIDRDGRRPDDIEAVIRWCQASDFWRSNVLSMPKFREKYDQLRLRMETERSGPTREHPADRNVAEILALRETA